MAGRFLFTSPRLGFRNRKQADLDTLARLNADCDQGYASEGAKRTLYHAFEDLGHNRVVSVCPVLNTASERVMRKIGMQRQGEFENPGLQGETLLNPCVWYEVKKT